MQVGSYPVDLASWGKPEDITVARPYYSNLAASSDLAGTVVAALAAASCALNKTDATLAASYLQAATVSHALVRKAQTTLLDDKLMPNRSFLTQLYYKEG